MTKCSFMALFTTADCIGLRKCKDCIVCFSAWRRQSRQTKTLAGQKSHTLQPQPNISQDMLMVTGQGTPTYPCPVVEQSTYHTINSTRRKISLSLRVKFL